MFSLSKTFNFAGAILRVVAGVILRVARLWVDTTRRVLTGYTSDQRRRTSLANTGLIRLSTAIPCRVDFPRPFTAHVNRLQNPRVEERRESSVSSKQTGRSSDANKKNTKGVPLHWAWGGNSGRQQKM